MWHACFSTFSQGWQRLAVAGTVLFVLAAGTHPVAYAGDDDHERARRALEQGKVLPLRGLLAQLERDYGGKVVKVEFEDDDDGAYLYEVRLVRPEGQVLEIEVNAVSGLVQDVEEDD